MNVGFLYIYFSFIRGFSLHAALSMLEEDDCPHSTDNIIMFPPDGAQTDEDSGGEDIVRPDNLPSSQLRAPGEIQFPVDSSEDTDSDDDNIPLALLVSKSDIKKPSKITKIYDWTSSDVVLQTPSVSGTFDQVELEQEYTEESPRSLFLKLFDENIIDRIKSIRRIPE